MKATGIARRIDELGRIVVPKEIRRTMRIKEGDPLEIYTDSTGKIVLKKYSEIGELMPFADQYCAVLAKSTGVPVLIADRDHVVSVCGAPKREFCGRRISDDLESLMENREFYSFLDESKKDIFPIEGVDNKANFIAPVVSRGDIIGSVIVLKGEKAVDKLAEEITRVSSELLGKYLED